ncbi:MAG: sarcosine oxidase subunit gamma family protein [Pseudomonadota bacterium]
MSEAVSALQGASFEGFVSVREMGLQGMVTLRGDLSAAKVKAAAKKVTGVGVPDVRHVAMSGDKGLAWMSPDELMVMVPYAEAGACVATLEAALKGQHFLAVNVSDARAVFEIKGAAVREVMAKLCPVDMAPGAFLPGQVRRTRMAQVAAAFWMMDDYSVRIICFRSVAEYVFGLLKDAAEPGGEVGFFTQPGLQPGT